MPSPQNEKGLPLQTDTVCKRGPIRRVFDPDVAERRVTQNMKGVVACLVNFPSESVIQYPPGKVRVCVWKTFPLSFFSNFPPSGTLIGPIPLSRTLNVIH